MTIAYRSGDFTVATAIGDPEFSAPFEGVNIDYVLKQKFQQLLANYVPAALNTPHPVYGDFLLVEEDEKRDVTGFVCEFTRTYAKIPATYSQPSSFPYNFIGYVTGGAALVTVLGRNRFTETVPARIQYDYFLLDETSGNIVDSFGNVVYAGTLGVLPSVINIPVKKEQQYYQDGLNAVWGSIIDDLIGYSSDATYPQLPYPTPFDSHYEQSPGVFTYLPKASAYPTREVYEAWIKRTATVEVYTPGTTINDEGTYEDTGLYEIVAQASRPDRWLGNIIQRATVYIRPK